LSGQGGFVVQRNFYFNLSILGCGCNKKQPVLDGHHYILLVKISQGEKLGTKNIIHLEICAKKYHRYGGN